MMLTFHHLKNICEDKQAKITPPPKSRLLGIIFHLICNDKISFLRCSKLSENDNFDGRNWLQVIHDFISFYDVCVAEIGSPF